ncbi:hypothetical protein Y032_0834g2591 [Ancylostoma ceylanicum]|uniref:Uncharacterized protein n=1 Tax=Ancylostoma ceylanicum TaxID=53326 RepID=A0A016WBS0_9BILA|nr:hypothetical protein Y032_0834g2591 [Ancylostoma ceylanicum]
MRIFKDHNVAKTRIATLNVGTLTGRSCELAAAFEDRRIDLRNEKIRERFGIAPIADKLRWTRLRWYVHVLRANEYTICKVGLNLEVPGKRPKGRPKQRWLDTLHVDLKHVGVHPDQAHDRVKWRQKIRKADPATEQD